MKMKRKILSQAIDLINALYSHDSHIRNRKWKIGRKLMEILFSKIIAKFEYFTVDGFLN